MSAEDDSNGRPPRRRNGVRFEPVITVGNLISMATITVIAIGGVWTVYTSLQKDIAATNQRIYVQETTIALVRQQVDASALAINRDRSEAQAFSAEMRGLLVNISELIAKLREDLARSGSVKNR